MVKGKAEVTAVRKPSPFNGRGEITVRELLDGPDQMYGKGRVFAHTTVYPGSELGYHVHQDESETYYILKGTARYNDNGTITTLSPGDVAHTPPGEGHGIEAAGPEPVEMIALILYS